MNWPQERANQQRSKLATSFAGRNLPKKLQAGSEASRRRFVLAGVGLKKGQADSEASRRRRLPSNPPRPGDVLAVSRSCPGGVFVVSTKMQRSLRCSMCPLDFGRHCQQLSRSCPGDVLAVSTKMQRSLRWSLCPRLLDFGRHCQQLGEMQTSNMTNG